MFDFMIFSRLLHIIAVWAMSHLRFDACASVMIFAAQMEQLFNGLTADIVGVGLNLLELTNGYFYRSLLRF